VRLALAEKGIDYAYREVNPFADPVPDGYLDLHPFRRVPVLDHDGFRLYETAAILRYIDTAFPVVSLEPEDADKSARMSQIISVMDSYAYWPLVRQVFSHGYYRPRVGEAPDAAVIEEGLCRSRTVLGALEDLIEKDASFLVGHSLSLADLHAFPMIDYFATAEEGVLLLAEFRMLNAWYEQFSARDTVIATRPTF